MKFLNCLFLYVLTMFFVSNFGLHAQFSFEAKILDDQTKRPVPFANITAFSGGDLVAGTSSNLDGIFALTAKHKPDSILITCVGYSKISLTSFDANTVFMKSRDKELGEVLILPGVNPALRIVRNAVDNRKVNDVQQFLDFSYEAYNVFNADAEQPNQSKIDSLHERQDSSALKAIEFFKSKQAFVSETYSRVQHKPVDNTKELILATQTSGLKNPIFSILANQVQPFSAYKNPMELFSKEYLNPLTNSGMKGYFYLLQDTTYLNQDTIFSIYFYPKPKSNFSGTRGTVYINSGDWSIYKIIFNFENPFGMELDQDEKGSSTISLGGEANNQNFATIIISYHKIDKYWFPQQVRTIYPLGNVTDDMPFNIFNTSYFRNYAFQDDFQKVKTGGAPLKVDPNADDKNSDFWDEIRGELADDRMDATYVFMDSITKKAQLDRLLMFSEALLDGQLRLRYVNVDMNKIIRFNDFEGFRLGLGLETNERVLQPLRFGGYFGYGFRDKTMKYGGHLRAIFLPAHKFEAKAYYHYDVNPTGLPTFVDPTGRIDQSEFIRSAYVRRMDYEEVWGLKIGSYLYKSMHLALSAEQKTVAAGYDYFYNNPSHPGSGSFFAVFETKAEFLWRIKDRYVQLGDKRLYLQEPRFPIINVQFTKGWDNIGRGDYAYDRVLLRISQQFKAMRLGKLMLRAEYQKTFGDVPIQMLIHTPGTFSSRFGVSAFNIFETVRPNEFLNDELMAAFINFEFNPWRIKKDKFEPIIGLRFNAGWGQLNNAIRHQLVQFQIMDKGFFEGGIMFDNLFKLSVAQYGFGVFYRMGAYKDANEWNNLAFKLSLRLGT